MERAIIAILHETGCRVSELLNIRLRDIERKEKHAMHRLDGKTGQRRVPIVQSLPWLQRWMEDHPFKENPNSLLWISTHNGHHGSPLRYIGITRLLKRVSDGAGITKKHNAHWFRHSRATLLVTQRYNDQIQCKYMGWVEGSKQQRTYVHIGAEQVEDAVLKNYGLLDEAKTAPRMQFCSCGTTNDSVSRYCFKCGNALNVATMLEDEQKKKAAIDDDIMWFATTLMTNPAMKKQFDEYKKRKQGDAR